MAARQEAVTRRPARAFPRLLGPCAVMADVADMHPPGGTPSQPHGHGAAARASQPGAPPTESRAIGTPQAVDAPAQIAPAAVPHTAPGPRIHGPGGLYPHAAARLMLRAALVLAFVLRRLAAGARRGSPAGGSARSGPATSPGAFLISTPLVPRA